MMGEFLQNNWFWILLLVFFVWMHGSGLGCGGHGGHRDDEEALRRTDSSGHRH